MLPGAIQAETIKMGYFEHHPHFITTEDGTPRGATIAYFEMVAEKMGYEVEWVGPLPMMRMNRMLNDGVLDGQPHETDIATYGETWYFADQPYHQAQAVFMVTQDNPLRSITTIEDVKGYRVGWIQHAPPSLFVYENQVHFQIDLIASNETMWERSLQKLLAGRIDAVHDLNLFTLPYIAKEMGIGDKVKTLILPEPPVPVYVVFSKQSPRGKELIEKYNQAQAELGFGHEDYVKLIQAEMEALTQK